MGNILDRLGIYDLLVIFLSGAIIVSITNFICNIEGEKFRVSLDDTMLFLVLSFFIGTIFQELSSLFFRKTLNKNRKILEDIFINTNDKSISLIEEEKEGLKKYFSKKKIDFDNKELIYNYCKYNLLQSGISVNGDNNQSISGLSRSLALYFGILGILFLFNSCDNIKHLVYSIICLLLCILLSARCIRFIKIRYVFIFRSFYYKYIEN